MAVAVASRKAPRIAASNNAVAPDVYEFVVMNDGPALDLRRRIAARVVARLVGPRRDPPHRACRSESGDVRVQEFMTALGDCDDAATVVAAVWPRRLPAPLLGAAMTVVWPLAARYDAWFLDVERCDADEMARADRGACVSVYAACKKSGVPRSIKEIALVFDVRPAAMTKAVRAFGQVVEDADEGACCAAGDFVGRGGCARPGPVARGHRRGVRRRAGDRRQDA